MLSALYHAKYCLDQHLLLCSLQRRPPASRLISYLVIFKSSSVKRDCLGLTRIAPRRREALYLIHTTIHLMPSTSPIQSNTSAWPSRRFHGPITMLLLNAQRTHAPPTFDATELLWLVGAWTYVTSPKVHRYHERRSQHSFCRRHNSATRGLLMLRSKGDESTDEESVRRHD